MISGIRNGRWDETNILVAIGWRNLRNTLEIYWREYRRGVGACLLQSDGCVKGYSDFLYNNFVQVMKDFARFLYDVMTLVGEPTLGLKY